MKKLKDRVAVVTGAAGGIGHAMARSFAAAGMKVVLAGISAGRLEKVVEEFKNDGARVLGVPTDVSDAGQVEALARQTLKEFGAVHVLCNNAGVAYGGLSSWETPLAAWKWVLDVNLMGVIHGIHAFLPIMLDQDADAHVVNTASNSGLVMNAHAVPYGVSKHAVVALSESLHLELMQRNARVKVSVLCPGPVSTDILQASQRNLPEAVPFPTEETPEETLLKKAYQIYIERGLDPEELGRAVFEAIQEEKFYIITHDYSRTIETRMQNILNAKNPDPQPPPPEFLNIVETLTGGANERS
jgi:NAD(P)-dependent dehydrogenase (short-subunit alcohol dehydrogenase family)